MKIFTGRDYYDIGLSTGHDDNLVFQRREDWMLNTSEMQALGFPTRRSLMLALQSKRKETGIVYTDNPFIMNGRAYLIYPVIVGFCGKLYYAYATVTDDGPAVVHWAENSLMDWLHDQEIDVLTQNWLKTQSIKNYYEQTITPTIYSWMVSERITTLSYVGDGPNTPWRVNAPNLKETQFAKVFDPYMAFQEITMWIGGVLSGSENPMIQLDDLMKVQKHGFDKKLSFRKAKAARK